MAPLLGPRGRRAPRGATAVAALGGLLGPAAADAWTTYGGLNCWDGDKGGIRVKESDLRLHNPVLSEGKELEELSLEECKDRCVEDAHCQGVLTIHRHVEPDQPKRGPCWLRKNLQVSECIKDTPWDLHVLDDRSSFSASAVGAKGIGGAGGEVDAQGGGGAGGEVGAVGGGSAVGASTAGGGFSTGGGDGVGAAGHAGEGQFDCQAGLVNWARGWSEAKKEWCCQNYGQGCITSPIGPASTGPLPTYSCETDGADWHSWSSDQKAWCCEHSGSGCLDVDFDCEAGDWNWEAGWSKEKMDYCCARGGPGCAGAWWAAGTRSWLTSSSVIGVPWWILLLFILLVLIPLCCLVCLLVYLAGCCGCCRSCLGGAAGAGHERRHGGAHEPAAVKERPHGLGGAAGAGHEHRHGGVHKPVAVSEHPHGASSQKVFLSGGGGHAAQSGSGGSHQTAGTVALVSGGDGHRSQLAKPPTHSALHRGSDWHVQTEYLADGEGDIIVSGCCARCLQALRQLLCCCPARWPAAKPAQYEFAVEAGAPVAQHEARFTLQRGSLGVDAPGYGHMVVGQSSKATTTPWRSSLEYEYGISNPSLWQLATRPRPRYDLF